METTVYAEQGVIQLLAQSSPFWKRKYAPEHFDEQPPKPTRLSDARRTHASRDGIFGHFGPVLVLCFTTAVCATLSILQISHHSTFDRMVHWVTSNRITISVIVQVIAHVLGWLWTWAVCKCLKNYAQHRLRAGIVLKDLRLWSALCTATVNWNLECISLMVMVLFLAMTLAPATIWVGALTPDLTTYPQNQSLSIARTGHESYSFLHPSEMGPTFGIACWSTVEYSGTFTNCPVWTFPGSIIDSAATASTPDGVPRNHSKMDKTRFRYSGRSYGVGVAPGLTDVSWFDDSVTSYKYQELGYLTSVNCIYNHSSLWTLKTLKIDGYLEDQFLPTIVRAGGWFPNSDWREIYWSKFDEASEVGWDFFSQISDGGTDNVVAVGSANSDTVEEYFITIAAGQGYSRLDKVQCQLWFTPTLFTVAVSNSDATITVKPTEQPAADPEPTKILRSNVLRNLNDLSQILTSMYISIIGSALMSNIENVVEFNSSEGSLGINQASNATILSGVSDSVLAMVDDILCSLNGASLTLPNSTVTTNALANKATLRIGNEKYTFATIGINIIALLLVTGITLYAHGWTGLGSFDFTDPGCLTIGTMAGEISTGLAQNISASFEGRLNEDSLIAQTFLRVKGKSDARHARLVLGCVTQP